jgi:hypothetical protein
LTDITHSDRISFSLPGQHYSFRTRVVPGLGNLAGALKNSINTLKIPGCLLDKYKHMRIPWLRSKEESDNKKHTILDSPEGNSLTIKARYFMLVKGCPGDTKTLVKFDGYYWRWISSHKKWCDDQTLTREDWFNGNLQSITKEEAKNILCS